MSEFEPTSRYVMEAVRDEMAPTSSDVFYDLGSGDGRFVTLMAESGVRASKGIENDSDLVRMSNLWLSTNPSLPNASIIEADLYTQDVSDGTIFWPAINYRKPTDRLTELKAIMPSGARVIVNDATWGWPRERDIVIPKARRTTAIRILIPHIDDTEVLNNFTLADINRHYPNHFALRHGTVGPFRFVVYRVP